MAASTNGASANGGHNGTAGHGLSVIITGAGVGGFAAALECHRKGHKVELFEKYDPIDKAIVVGDVFTIGRSGMQFFKQWPEMLAEFQDISFKTAKMMIFKTSGELMKGPMPLGEAASGRERTGVDDLPMYLQLRAHFNAMLYKQVLKCGIPVHTGMRAVKYFEDAAAGKGGVVFEDGKRLTADVVIAADGLGSKSRDLILNEEPEEPLRANRSLYRSVIPIEVIEKDPEVRDFFTLVDGKHSVMRQFRGQGTYSMIFRHPGGITMGVDHQGDGTEIEDWQPRTHKAAAVDVVATLDKFPGWHPAVYALARVIPAGNVIHWPLVWRNPAANWVAPAGRVVQIGDSSHPFLPPSGNGATQALEDAVTLAECLRRADGTAGVPDACKVYNKLRFERVSQAQLLGFSNTEMMQRHTPPPPPGPPQKPRPLLPRWIYEHDPEPYCVDNYDACLAHVRGDAAFENTNTPPGSVYKPWTIRGVMAEAERTQRIELDGDWS